MGIKRGTWVRHPRYGLCYVGGTSEGRISLHALDSGQRVYQKAKPEDCVILKLPVGESDQKEARHYR